MKISFLIHIYIFIIFISCKENINEFEIQRESIIGHWRVDQLDRIQYTNDTLLLDEEDIYVSWEFDFSANGLGASINPDVNESVEIEWHNQLYPEKIFVHRTRVNNGVSTVFNTIYNIIESPSCNMKLNFERELLDIGGNTQLFQYTLYLSKKQ